MARKDAESLFVLHNPKIDPADGFAQYLSNAIDEFDKWIQGGIDEKDGQSLLERVQFEARTLWRTFPSQLAIIYKPGNYDPARHAELKELLFKTHHWATDCLSSLAAANGIKGSAIRKAGHLCRALMRRDFTRYYAPPSTLETFWPDCLGDEYHRLPGHQQRVIDKAQKAFDKLETWELFVDSGRAAADSAKTDGKPADGANTNGTPDWNELITSPPLPATRIAEKLGEPVGLVERVLRHQRKVQPFCFAVDDSPQKGKARYLHKLPDVIPALKAWFEKRRKKQAKASG